MTEEKKDLKPESGDDGQPENKEEPKELSAEEVKKLQEDNKQLGEDNVKLVADNVNYKKAIVNKEADKFSLEDEPEETPPVPAPPKPEPQKEEEAWQEVDKRARDISAETYDKSQKKEVKQAEKVAIKRLLTEDPELAQNPNFIGGMKEYYVNRHGKTVDGIMLDLKDGLSLYKVNNNIALAAEEEKPKPEAEIPAPGVGAGTGGVEEKKQAGNQFSEKEREIMDNHLENIEPDRREQVWAQYKKGVLDETISAPQEVVNLFKSNP